MTKGWGYQNNPYTQTELIIEGSVIQFNYSIPILDGWAIIGYLHQNPYNAVDMLAGIESDFIILKDYQGNLIENLTTFLDIS